MVGFKVQGSRFKVQRRKGEKEKRRRGPFFLFSL
jgi:hypothetical protein